MNWLIVDEIIKNALKEDIPSEDITTTPLVTENSLCSVNLISKEDGILAGAEVFARVFALLGDVDVSFNKEDGDILKKGEIIAIIKGKTKNVLLGERVALNLLQRMCGIATLTNNFSKKLIGTNAKLADTRKTTPNLRILEKYSVKIGGGINHRCNLSDGILIKDNHIQFLESPCRDKLCVKAGILKNSPLICMPNGIIIRFENNFDKDIEIDSIVW